MSSACAASAADSAGTVCVYCLRFFLPCRSSCRVCASFAPPPPIAPPPPPPKPSTPTAASFAACVSKYSLFSSLQITRRSLTSSSVWMYPPISSSSTSLNVSGSASESHSESESESESESDRLVCFSYRRRPPSPPSPSSQ